MATVDGDLKVEGVINASSASIGTLGAGSLSVSSINAIQEIAAGGVSQVSGSLQFANGGGVSFGLNAGTITATVVTTYLTTAAASNHSHGDPTLNLTNLSGTTASNSAGLTLSLSANPAQSNLAFSADASSTFQTLTFQDSNGISFSNNGGALRLTHGLQFTSATSAITSNALATAEAFRAVYDGANSISTGTMSLANANGFSFSVNGQTLSGSVVTTWAPSNHSHGNPTLALTNLTGTTASASDGFTLSLSAAAPGAAAITQSMGISTQTAGGSTDGTSGYATGDDILYHFVPGSNITMSQSLDGASATLSIYGPAAGGVTLSAWNPYQNALVMIVSLANASLWLIPKDVQVPFQYDRMVMPLRFSQATNSTLTVSNTLAWGWFSRNGDSLSLYKSGSGTFSINGSGTASSAANSGVRIVSIGSTDTITAGNYYLGFVWRSSTAGANASISNLCISQWASTYSGYIGLASNTRMQLHTGGGIWTSTTVGMPNSIAFSDIRGNSSAFHRPPIHYFTSGEQTY